MRVAGRLFRAAGIIPGHDWEAERQSVLAAVNRHCFDQERHRYTDVPGKAYFSCHVNAWAILAGAADSGLRTELSAALTEDPGLTGCTLYFAFYLLEAMHRTGNDAGFETVLKQWEPMLELGFTTFPECPSADTRSDCHAWSAGPLYHLLRHYAGVYPAEPGYAVVGVEPAAGLLRSRPCCRSAGGRLLTVSGRPGDGLYALVRLPAQNPAEGRHGIRSQARRTRDRQPHSTRYGSGDSDGGVRTGLNRCSCGKFPAL